MRAVLQRVTSAEVSVASEVIGKIQNGLLVLVGITATDSEKECKWLAEKIANLRIFADSDDKMNLSVKELTYGVLVISQFTLYGNCLNGRRPDFIQAAKPEQAIPLYNNFISRMNDALGYSVETGRFGAKMQVHLVNDGPVTMLIETP